MHPESEAYKTGSKVAKRYLGVNKEIHQLTLPGPSMKQELPEPDDTGAHTTGSDFNLEDASRGSSSGSSSGSPVLKKNPDISRISSLTYTRYLCHSLSSNLLL